MPTANAKPQTSTPGPKEPTHTELPSTFERMARIDCSEHIERKGNLSYLSWAWAVDYLLREDPTATWSYHFFDGKPYCQIGDTAMVFCTVRAYAIERTAQLPVMDHRNKPIANPNSFELNTAMQRCLAKAIALHGVGLYIYQGEDLPLDDDTVAEPVDKPPAKPAIKDKELSVIEKLADQAGVSIDVILDRYKAKALTELSEEDFKECIAKLQTRIAEKGKKAA